VPPPLFLGYPLAPVGAVEVVVIQAAYRQALITPGTHHFLLVAANRGTSHEVRIGKVVKFSMRSVSDIATVSAAN